jgi:hypothetical protein
LETLLVSAGRGRLGTPNPRLEPQNDRRQLSLDNTEIGMLASRPGSQVSKAQALRRSIAILIACANVYVVSRLQPSLDPCSGIVVVLSASLAAQALISSYLMLYAWEHRERMAQTRCPRATVAEYVVQPGDSLHDIASQHGTDVQALMTMNGMLDSNAIVAGSALRVPVLAAGPARASAEENP